MAFILKGSPECVKSELELFHLPATQMAIEDGHWVEFHPLSNVFDGGPVEFHISGSGEEYVDLSQTQLYVKAKIVKADGTPLEKDEKIGSVNLFMHFLFSQMDISLNDRLVLNSSNTYSYRSKVRISPGVILRHAKALENDTERYHLNRVLCKVYSVPQGSMSFVRDNIFVGQMPKRIIVGCVDNDAFHDTFQKSPFDFKLYHMNFIGIYVDGQPKPHAPLELNFDKNNYIKDYHSLFS
ncbi:uncharacterized protein F54H12.2 [Caerostris darwini]|uniref:Uncharacterized protein F54H12.2 n=1 Tax=Caerostris darwini TaxID=1538125 RepID=A0AAV4W0W5_9ARAC|nr:uncharacterized protein F54H12.2 [Caerostris darwini]